MSRQLHQPPVDRRVLEHAGDERRQRLLVDMLAPVSIERCCQIAGRPWCGFEPTLPTGPSVRRDVLLDFPVRARSGSLRAEDLDGRAGHLPISRSRAVRAFVLCAADELSPPAHVLTGEIAVNSASARHGPPARNEC